MHSDNFISISGYVAIRQDRDSTKTNEQVGDGLLVYIKNNWYNSYCIASTLIKPDIEIMTVKVRPFLATQILVYCPLFDSPTSTKVKIAVTKAHQTIKTTELQISYNKINLFTAKTQFLLLLQCKR